MDAANTPKLFVRDGNRILPAATADEEIARKYPTFSNKGSIIDGLRLTILTRDITFQSGDPVRVIHVCEAVTADAHLHVMGPKPVYGEHVDGILSTPAVPSGQDPLVPAFYDGRVINGPAIDYNYEITQYTFNEPGTYVIQWRPGILLSNECKIQIMSR